MPLHVPSGSDPFQIPLRFPLRDFGIFGKILEQHPPVSGKDFCLLVETIRVA
jgi:hypothetical protein